MVAHLRFVSFPTNGSDPAFSAAGDFYTGQYESAVVGIRALDYVLRSNASNVTIDFPRQQRRRFPYRVQSHSDNDDFLFFTNILPIDIETIPFNVTVDFDRATYRYVPGGPNYVHFDVHHTLYALDNSNATCWRPNRTVHRDEYFAIDFLRIQSNLTLSIVVGSNLTLQENIDVRISFDGVDWQSLVPLENFIIETTSRPTLGKNGYRFNSSEYSADYQWFRYIGFFATEASQLFDVCDVRLL